MGSTSGRELSSFNELGEWTRAVLVKNLVLMVMPPESLARHQVVKQISAQRELQK